MRGFRTDKGGGHRVGRWAAADPEQVEVADQGALGHQSNAVDRNLQAGGGVDRLARFAGRLQRREEGEG